MTLPFPPFRLILASASPRRRQLLAGLDLPVRITQVDVEEKVPIGMPAYEVAEALALLKADSWQGRLEKDQVLITADTTVILDDTLLNKPVDEADAERMLDLLSGRTHVVTTGVCMRTVHRTISFTDEARVTFRQLRRSDISYYVKQYAPLDKAGAYGVQDWIGYTAVERIEGSFYTVMGLPMHRVFTGLLELGKDMKP